MARDSVMLSSSPAVGKSLREIYDLGLNEDYTGWWVAVKQGKVMDNPIQAISPSIDTLVEFCRKREYLANVTYEPIRAERPACLKRVA